MITWRNLDTLDSWKKLEQAGKKVNLPEVLAGEAGAERVKSFAVKMGGGLTYYYGAKQVDEEMDRLWENGQWDEKKLQELRGSHFRTPYNK